MIIAALRDTSSFVYYIVLQIQDESVWIFSIQLILKFGKIMVVIASFRLLVFSKVLGVLVKMSRCCQELVK